MTDGYESENSNTKRHNGHVSNHTNGFVNGPTNGTCASTTNGENDVTSHTNGFVNGPTNGHAEGAEEEDNPTVMPTDMLRGFHWTFLIRHPRRSIPSYYRCTIPPLDAITGFHEFMPSEAGYDELRRLFDYLLAQGIIGPRKAGESAPLDEALNGGSASDSDSISSDRPRRAAITVIDADDLLQNPEAILKVYCKEVGIDYTPKMLEWGDDENQQYAAKAFEKWYGFHHDAIDSTCLKPRPHGTVSCPPPLHQACLHSERKKKSFQSLVFCPLPGANVDFLRCTENSYHRGRECGVAQEVWR